MVRPGAMMGVTPTNPPKADLAGFGWNLARGACQTTLSAIRRTKALFRSENSPIPSLLDRFWPFVNGRGALYHYIRRQIGPNGPVSPFTNG